MDPSQIGFFHALNITTKINKGMIEILKDVLVLKNGQTVGASEASLLDKMRIRPFHYGMEIIKVYEEGTMLDKKVIDFEPSMLIDKFQSGVNYLNAISLETGYAIPSAVPHMIMNAFKNLAGVALETGYKLDALEAAKNAAPAATTVSTDKKVAAKVEEPEEKEEEEDMDMGDLFG